MPPPSRERLSRPVDISTLFRGAARAVDLKVDEPGLRWAGLSGDPTRNISSSPSSRARRNSRRTFAGGPENRTPARTARSGRGRGRGRGRVLPHWYPRTPLRDITAIVRAIERRRAQLHQNDQVIEPPQEETSAPSLSSSTSSAQLEHEAVGGSTFLPALSVEPQTAPSTQIGKVLANIPNEEKGGNSSVITPQKRLLDSIDEVRDVLVERRQKLEKTPAAKKAEREKKVRTLMSMR